jgi:hypothetical protein
MARERRLEVVIAGDSRGAQRAFDDTESHARGFGSRFGGIATGIAGAIGGAFAVGAIVDFGSQLFTLGGQLEALNLKVDTVFGDQAARVRDWADANNEALGVTDDQLSGLTASFADLLKPMGFTTGEAADMSMQMLDLSGALSAWSGGQRSATEVADILSAAMLGERDALQGLGISISAAEVQARLAAKGQEDLTGAALAQAEAIATQELILEKSTDAQAAWASGGAEAMMASNGMTAGFAEIKETLATALMPTLTSLGQWLAERLPGWIETAKGYIEDFRVGWGRIQESIRLFVDTARPYIEAFIGFVTGAWQTFGDDLIRVADGAWQIIKGVVEGAMEIIHGIINVVMGIIHGDFSQVWDGIKGIFSGAIDAILAVARGGFDLLSGLLGGILNGIASTFSSVWEGIINFFTGIPGQIASIASGMFDGIKNAFRSAINWLIDAWNGLEFRIPGFDPPGPGPSFGGFTLGMPNIPRLAQGGIVTGPTLALIGEGRHDEAVIPLDGRSMGNTVVLQNHGVIGSEAELNRWLSGALATLSREGRLTGLRT